MADWEFKAYDAEENVHYGQETASSFPELALKIRQQRSLQIIEATKLNKDGTLAAQRLAKMRARVGVNWQSPKKSKRGYVLLLL